MDTIDIILNEGALTNFKIIQICRDLNINLDGVIMNNQFTNKMLDYDFSIIINFENYNRSGSHWVAMYNDTKNKTVYYNDSYGERPTGYIENIINKKGYSFYFNNTQFQAIESQLCGFFSIYFLYMMQKNKNKIQGMNKYLSKFTSKVSDYNENDKRVRKLLLPIAKKNIKY